jgi:hypothetical protein
MRNVARRGALSVRVIAGSHVVVLAWDIDEGQWEQFGKGLLGIAIERTEHSIRGDADSPAVERYWLRGMKRFEEVDKGAAVGAMFPLSEHPVQGFQWGDYTAKPGFTYTYRLVPVRGKPKLLELREDEAVSVPITTELEDDGDHGVWFNRGVAGSQAYVRRFGMKKPDPAQPLSEQMSWLSRGLYEALVRFIGEATGPTFQLRGALYELRYAPVLDALRAAIEERNVDVRILYDEPNYGAENRTFIDAAGIQDACTARSGNKSQKHNKFLVLIEDGEPKAVWTGSTNISPGGIFGHCNVGHSVRNAELAGQYLAYWNLLSNDPAAENKVLRPHILQATPTPADPRPAAGTSVMFSPRKGNTLDWYATLMKSAGEIACFTVAFTIADAFFLLFEEDTDVLRYILKDKAGDSQLTLDEEVIIAFGAKLEKDEFPGWLEEVLTGFNKNLWVHNKFLLVDPLSDDPVVATGSANFSVDSMSANDENMLLIRGNVRVADMYFGEFMRVFDHHYSRTLIKRALAAGEEIKKNYLKPNAVWMQAHLEPGPKARRRRYFRGPLQP